ncbi:MAG TPA: SGNH/GDSL hydrolase family protein [Nostocaceae cyanobacterium]|nr:SGNH/GDSL hydrolase family protein [Nostocaceae cyanobacterium]
MKTVLLIIVVLVGLLVVIEWGLRSLFGFGYPLIYIPDEQIGYLLAPNQQTYRFRNRIAINQYSMRSEPIEKDPAPSTFRLLLLGDSIANGGWWTDQTNTISSLLKRKLTDNRLNDYTEIEVLNASANSWSPRNELAYLQRFGTFQAQIIILLINTDDLFGIAPTSLQVGRDRNYPDHRPPLAIIEVWQRYATKPRPIPEMESLYAEGGDRVGIILAAIQEIYRLTQENNSQFLLAMTPLLREIETAPRDYEIIARQRLSNFTEKNKISYIDFLPIFQNLSNPHTLYQDHIHLNQQGNQLVTDVIIQSLPTIPREN